MVEDLVTHMKWLRQPKMMMLKKTKRKAVVERYFAAVVERKEYRNKRRSNLKSDEFEKVSHED